MHPDASGRMMTMSSWDDTDVEYRDPGDMVAARSLLFNRAVWIAWWAGTALIVMSWFGVVTNGIGWVGFGIALTSTLASVIVRRYWRFPG